MWRGRGISLSSLNLETMWFWFRRLECGVPTTVVFSREVKPCCRCECPPFRFCCASLDEHHLSQVLVNQINIYVQVSQPFHLLKMSHFPDRAFCPAFVTDNRLLPLPCREVFWRWNPTRQMLIGRSPSQSLTGGKIIPSTINPQSKAHRQPPSSSSPTQTSQMQNPIPRCVGLTLHRGTANWAWTDTQTQRI
jgi:hypothetical protein